MPPSNETVGFIGLGTIGRPMAANLARTGFEALGTDAPLSRDMKARWAAAVAALGPDADFTRAVTHWKPK